MKSTIQRVLFVATVTALGAGAVGSASAQTSSAPTAVAPQQHPHHGHFGHMGGARFVGTLLRATRQLGLSDQQKASIKNIMASARPAAGAAPQHPAMTVLGNPGDSGYAAAVQSEQAAASARIQKETMLASDIYGVLSKTQRDQLPSVLASMQAKEEAHRAQWASRRAATSNG